MELAFLLLQVHQESQTKQPQEQKLHSNKRAIVLITHYQRLLNQIEPDYIHIMNDGKIITTGGKELANILEESGYEGIENISKQ